MHYIFFILAALAVVQLALFIFVLVRTRRGRQGGAAPPAPRKLEYTK